MKKIRYLITIFISILVVFCIKNVCYAESLTLDSFPTDQGGNLTGSSITLSHDSLVNGQNLFCLQYLQVLNSPTEYTITDYLKIEDGKGSWNGNEAQEDDSYKVIAELLSGKYGSEFGDMNADGTSNYSEAQQALWIYKKALIQAGIDAGELDESWFNDNRTGGGDATLDKALNNALNGGTSFNGSMDVYFMESTTSSAQFQKVIVVVPHPESGTVKIEKVSTGTDKPLEGVEFTIEKIGGDGAFSTTVTTDKSGNFSLDNLEPGTYKVTETKPADGYSESAGLEYTFTLAQGEGATIKIENTEDEEGDEPEPGGGDGNVTIEGNVWNTGGSGKDGQGGKDGVPNVKVSWYGGNGGLLAETITDAQGYYKMGTSVGIYNDPYRIDSGSWQNVNNSYVEFTYNGMKYTTVAPVDMNGDEDGSRAIEGTYDDRAVLDSKFTYVTPSRIGSSNITYQYASDAVNLSDEELTYDKYSKVAVTASTKSIIHHMIGKKVDENTDEIYGYTEALTGGMNTSYCYYEESYYIKKGITDNNPAFLKFEDFTNIGKYGGGGEWNTKYTVEGDLGVVTGVDHQWREHPWDQACIHIPSYMSSAGGNYWYDDENGNGKQDFAEDENEDGKIDEEERKKYEPAYHFSRWCNSGEHKRCDDKALFGEDGHGLRTSNVITGWKIQHVNLKLFEREQPKLGVDNDINNVVVIMNGQKYTYTYAFKNLQAPVHVIANVGGYERKLNPSDVTYAVTTDPSALEVYVTYDIVGINNSNTLPMKINEISHYVDASQYELSPAEKKRGNWFGGGSSYSRHISTGWIEPGGVSNVYQIELKIKEEVLYELFNEDYVLFHTSSGISSYTTGYGAGTRIEDGKSGGIRHYQLYAGICGFPSKEAPIFRLSIEDDKYKFISGTVYEDSATNISDGQRLGNGTLDDENKVANVKVELLTKTIDGKGYETAKLYLRVDNKDENYCENYSGTKVAKIVDAVTWTDEQGEYKFKGVISDYYQIRFTYGNGITKVEDKITTEPNKNSNPKANISGTEKYPVGWMTVEYLDAEGTESTKINDNYEINARNYKSTIVVNNTLINVIKGEIGNTPETAHMGQNTIWYLTDSDIDSKSIAVDDIDQRLEIDDLYYNNFDDGEFMQAVSPEFAIQIEYTAQQNAKLYGSQHEYKVIKTNEKGDIIDSNDTKNNIYTDDGIEWISGEVYNNPNSDDGKANFDNNCDVFDFGIIERARENIVIDTTISHLKITLADGQVLTEGNPYADKMSYVKAVGKSVNTREETIKVNPKLISIEMDQEIIQSARIDITYTTTVTNNSEYDEQYISETKNEDGETIDWKYNNKNSYYYFGQKTGNEIKLDAKTVVQYIDEKLVFDEDEVINQTWTKVSAKDLYNNGEGFIAESAKNKLEAEKYTIFTTDQFKDIKRGQSHEEKLFVSKLLANDTTDLGYTYTSHAEILEINAEVARNIDSTDNGAQITKQYKPGNYIPSLSRINAGNQAAGAGIDNEGYTDKASKKVNGILEFVGFHTQDDDMIKVVITPPTGLTNNTIIYILALAVGLIVLIVGINFIKKKVLK